MSSRFVCGTCGTSANIAGGAYRRTDDGKFNVVVDDTGWLDVVSDSPGAYFHAQFCSHKCAIDFANVLEGLGKLPAFRRRAEAAIAVSFNPNALGKVIAS